MATTHASRLLRSGLAGLLAMSAFIVAGCSEHDLETYLGHNDTVTVGAGNSSASNRVTHATDVWPQASRKNKIDLDGKRAALAAKRYETNTSIEPRGLGRDGDVEIELQSNTTAIKN
jgi:hypothetical protein